MCPSPASIISGGGGFQRILRWSLTSKSLVASKWHPRQDTLVAGIVVQVIVTITLPSSQKCIPVVWSRAPILEQIPDNIDTIIITIIITDEIVNIKPKVVDTTVALVSWLKNRANI